MFLKVPLPKGSVPQSKHRFAKEMCVFFCARELVVVVCLCSGQATVAKLDVVCLPLPR